MAYRIYKVFHQAYTAGRVASCKSSKDFLKNKTTQQTHFTNKKSCSEAFHGALLRYTLLDS